jgi:hypothetical protein
MNPDEKIGFIYYDTDTEIYKLLSSATYKDRVDFKQGNSSQGLEGKYYIIDDSAGLENEEYWDDLYTGISRAIQGSIVLHTKDSYKTNNSNPLFYSFLNNISGYSPSAGSVSKKVARYFESGIFNLFNKAISFVENSFERAKDESIISKIADFFK